MRQIVLASSSPRRKELLEKFGLCFTVDAGSFREDLSQGMEPHKLAREISLGKADSVAWKYPDAVVIGVDTFGILGNRILGKPETEDEARAMLSAISDRSHLVITGFTVIDTASGKIVSHSVETKVYMRQLSPQEIESYIKTGEPLGKAGGYAIQGLGALFVEKIEGDYLNVVGLPMYALMNTLKEFGISIL
jgi:septum formation protein